MNDEILEINSLFKKYGDFYLWKNVSNIFKKGTLTTIIGRSGSGKTTLLNCCGLLEGITNGNIYFNQNNITNLSFNKKISLYRNYFGFLFQNSGLIDNWTVDKNLDIFLEYSKKTKKEKLSSKKDVLKMVGLEKFNNHNIYTLSGGEQQRVALARVMLKNPKIIFVDEPTASLDKHNANIVKNILLLCKEKNMTIIISTHDDNFIKISDNVINLEEYKK